MKTLPIADSDQNFYPPLADAMKVDLVVNSSGSIWILHDRPLPALVTWADYDSDAGTVTFATDKGKTQELGIQVPRTMTGTLQEATQVSVLLMENRKVTDFTIIPLNTISSIRQ